MQTSILLSAVEARARRVEGGGGTCRLNKEYELKAVWHKSISPMLFYPHCKEIWKRRLRWAVFVLHSSGGATEKFEKEQ
jgi:hypothetical protein